jgi:poly-beta-1,6-N-acetyl-D-glucosamine synthase
MKLSYVLITPARNEARYIRETLDSVVAQVHQPLRWVIVDDGSTDRTEEIAGDYARRFPWIQVVRLGGSRRRSFAAKVDAFNAGLHNVAGLEFDVIGNLDADISFEPDYFAFLLGKFANNPRLGVAGTPFVERGTHYDYRFTNIQHVSGACQLFRRHCFEDVGGYVPIAGGGIDWVAVTTARMRGWETQTFTEMTCLHHRPMGTGTTTSEIQALFRHGRKDYALGGHPVWQVCRCLYQTTRPPYVMGGLALFAGYGWAAIRRVPRPVSPSLVAFHRAEQMARLRATVSRIGRNGSGPSA